VTYVPAVEPTAVNVVFIFMAPLYIECHMVPSFRTITILDKTGVVVIMRHPDVGTESADHDLALSPEVSIIH